MSTNVYARSPPGLALSPVGAASPSPARKLKKPRKFTFSVHDQQKSVRNPHATLNYRWSPTKARVASVELLPPTQLLQKIRHEPSPHTQPLEDSSSDESDSPTHEYQQIRGRRASFQRNQDMLSPNSGHSARAADKLMLQLTAAGTPPKGVSVTIRAQGQGHADARRKWQAERAAARSQAHQQAVRRSASADEVALSLWLHPELAGSQFQSPPGQGIKMTGSAGPKDALQPQHGKFVPQSQAQYLAQGQHQSQRERGSSATAVLLSGRGSQSSQTSQGSAGRPSSKLSQRRPPKLNPAAVNLSVTLSQAANPMSPLRELLSGGGTSVSTAGSSWYGSSSGTGGSASSGQQNGNKLGRSAGATSNSKSSGNTGSSRLLSLGSNSGKQMASYANAVASNKSGMKSPTNNGTNGTEPASSGRSQFRKSSQANKHRRSLSCQALGWDGPTVHGENMDPQTVINKGMQFASGGSSTKKPPTHQQQSKKQKKLRQSMSHNNNLFQEKTPIQGNGSSQGGAPSSSRSSYSNMASSGKQSKSQQHRRSVSLTINWHGSGDTQQLQFIASAASPAAQSDLVTKPGGGGYSQSSSAASGSCVTMQSFGSYGGNGTTQQALPAPPLSAQLAAAVREQEEYQRAVRRKQKRDRAQDRVNKRDSGSSIGSLAISQADTTSSSSSGSSEGSQGNGDSFRGHRVQLDSC